MSLDLTVQKISISIVPVSNQPSSNNANNTEIGCQSPYLPYTQYLVCRDAHEEFHNQFLKIPIYEVCHICHRLSFISNDVKIVSPIYENILRKGFPQIDMSRTKICGVCHRALLSTRKIPGLSVSNGFYYPKKPIDLPPLDSISARLLSPRLPFLKIRRLRHVPGRPDNYEQAINIPQSIDNFTYKLPRFLENDHCINVHIDEKKMYKSGELSRFINKDHLKRWMEYLINTPLYRQYNIEMNSEFFNESNKIPDDAELNKISEEVSLEDSLKAQQQTLLFHKKLIDQISVSLTGTNKSVLLHNFFFEQDGEELAFPTIYLGQRKGSESTHAKIFKHMSSELRRYDRRGVIPEHLLYMAMKMMQFRMKDVLAALPKEIRESTSTNLSEENINIPMEALRGICRYLPDSPWYWSEQRNDVFALIRQFGRPSFILTLHANEIGCNRLLKLLYELQNKGAIISEDDVALLDHMKKVNLINQDAVCCVLYFNKLVNVLLNICQLKVSPFRPYYLEQYFKRITFNENGSPCVHIFLWLSETPEEPLGQNNTSAIFMINMLVRVSQKDSSGHLNLQTHQHNANCYEKNGSLLCKVDAPFMPSRWTVILSPMPKTNKDFPMASAHYAQIKKNLETENYRDINDFYTKNNIYSDIQYLRILQAGIKRPQIFLEREPSEKWIIPFNPFFLNITEAFVEMHFILDEYSCSRYIVDYVCKSKRTISDLQQQLLDIMNEHEEFNLAEILEKMSVKLLKGLEMTTQEAAWYLLQEPTTESSAKIIYIPTVHPSERKKNKKTTKSINKRDSDDRPVVAKDDWFDIYENRELRFDSCTLAFFVEGYIRSELGCTDRNGKRVIRYRNYDPALEFNDFRREMVTLHIPFRNEQKEIIQDDRYLHIYDENEELIRQRRNAFESHFNIREVMGFCREMFYDSETKRERDPLDVPDPLHIPLSLVIEYSRKFSMDYVQRSAAKQSFSFQQIWTHKRNCNG